MCYLVALHWLSNFCNNICLCLCIFLQTKYKKIRDRNSLPFMNTWGPCLLLFFFFFCFLCCLVCVCVCVCVYFIFVFVLYLVYPMFSVSLDDHFYCMCYWLLANITNLFIIINYIYLVSCCFSYCHILSKCVTQSFTFNITSYINIKLLSITIKLSFRKTPNAWTFGFGRFQINILNEKTQSIAKTLVQTTVILLESSCSTWSL
jgi:hypothetical protein